MSSILMNNKAIKKKKVFKMMNNSAYGKTIKKIIDRIKMSHWN